jgi:hypothetical protein
MEENLRDIMAENHRLQDVVDGLQRMVEGQGREISGLRQEMGVRAPRRDTSEDNGGRQFRARPVEAGEGPNTGETRN